MPDLQKQWPTGDEEVADTDSPAKKAKVSGQKKALSQRSLYDKLDPGNLRYGMSTAEKEALAASGSLPSAPKDTSVDLDRANRYAAGYLFGKTWPNVAPVVQPFIDRVKTSNLPILGGSSPDLQSLADQGVNIGRAAAPAPDPSSSSALALLLGGFLSGVGR